MMARPVVDFPQPDSPTSPRVSPLSTSKLMPETAFTRKPGVAERELDDELLDREQRVAVGSEVGGAGAGHSGLRRRRSWQPESTSAAACSASVARLRARASAPSGDPTG